MSTEQPDADPKFKRLPPLVWKLGWISFFADICSEMAYPVLPLFLTGVLKAPAGILGVVEGLSEAVVSFLKGWSGWHSDNIGKRVPFIRWGYALSAIGKPILAVAGAWPAVLTGRLIDRFGKGIRTTARDTLIAEAVPQEQYGRAYGLHRAMDTAGAFVGVAVALMLLMAMPGNYRFVLAAAVIPGIISVLFTFFVHEPKVASVGTTAPKVHFGDLRNLGPAYYRALIVTTLFALANSSDTFLLLRAKQMGLSDTSVILAYMAYNVVVAALAAPLGAMSDKWGRYRLIFVGWLLFAAIYFGFGLNPGNAIWLLFGGYGVYYALSQGASKALAADHSPAAFKGTAIGFMTMVAGFATLAGNIVTGVLWDVVSPQAALWTSATLAALAAMGIPLTRRRGG